MCRTCRQHCRIVKFDFQCSKLYHDYAKSTAYNKPDLSMNNIILPMCFLEVFLN